MFFDIIKEHLPAPTIDFMRRGFTVFMPYQTDGNLMFGKGDADGDAKGKHPRNKRCSLQYNMLFPAPVE